MHTQHTYTRGFLGLFILHILIYHYSHRIFPFLEITIVSEEVKVNNFLEFESLSLHITYIYKKHKNMYISKTLKPFE